MVIRPLKADIPSGRKGLLVVERGQLKERNGKGSGPATCTDLRTREAFGADLESDMPLSAAPKETCRLMLPPLSERDSPLYEVPLTQLPPPLHSCLGPELQAWMGCHDAAQGKGPTLGCVVL